MRKATLRRLENKKIDEDNLEEREQKNRKLRSLQVEGAAGKEQRTGKNQ